MTIFAYFAWVVEHDKVGANSANAKVVVAIVAMTRFSVELTMEMINGRVGYVNTADHQHMHIIN